MLDRIANAIELAQANAPFYVMPRYKNKYDVYEILPVYQQDFCHLALASQDEAENLCEKLNKLYVARKVVEVLKEIPGCDECCWSDRIDAILKSKS